MFFFTTFSPYGEPFSPGAPKSAKFRGGGCKFDKGGVKLGILLMDIRHELLQ